MLNHRVLVKGLTLFEGRGRRDGVGVGTLFETGFQAVAIEFELVELLLELPHGMHESGGFEKGLVPFPGGVEELVREFGHRHFPLFLSGSRKRVVVRRRHGALAGEFGDEGPENAIWAGEERGKLFRVGGIVVGGVIEGKYEDFVSGVWPALVARHGGIFLGFGSLFLVGVGFSVDNGRGRMVVVRWCASGVPCCFFSGEFVEFTVLLYLQEEKGI